MREIGSEIQISPSHYINDHTSRSMIAFIYIPWWITAPWILLGVIAGSYCHRGVQDPVILCIDAYLKLLLNMLDNQWNQISRMDTVTKYSHTLH